MGNQIALFIAIFFILFSFIGIFRKPLTCVALIFIIQNILGVLIPSLDNMIVVISISAVFGIILSILLYRYRVVYGFVYGFVVVYLTFFHIISAVDAVMSLFGSETSLLSNVLTDQFVLSPTMFKLCTSLATGVVIAIFNKRGMESISSLLGTFMFVIFIIDIFRGGVSSSIEFSEIFSNLLSTVDSIVIKNSQVYSLTLSSDNYLHIIMALGFAVIACITTSYIKREKYDFL